MKTLKRLLLIGIATSLLMVGCATTPKKDAEPSAKPTPAVTATADDSLNYIKTNGKIILGLDDAFPPMGFRDEKTNEIIGVDVDIAKAVGEKLSVTIELKPIDWKAKEMELNTKKIDVIWNGFSITDERKASILFSRPYLDNTQAIIVPANSKIKTKADLAGKKIGVQGGSSAKDAMKTDTALYASIGDSNVKEYDTMLLALTDLKIGRIDAVVADKIVGDYNITKIGEKYVVLADNFSKEEYGVGFRKGDEGFKKAVDKALDELKADGTLAKISKKWFGIEDAIK